MMFELTDDVVFLLHELCEVGSFDSFIEDEFELVLRADVVYYAFFLTPVFWRWEQRVHHKSERVFNHSGDESC